MNFTALGTIKWSDFWRGFIVAILTAPLTIIYQSLSTIPMSLVFDWNVIIGTAIAGGIGYILKNFLTGMNGNLLTNKP